jgi:hypothetical protein
MPCGGRVKRCAICGAIMRTSSTRTAFTRCEMADLIDELVEHPARTVRLMAVGEVPE